MNSFQSLSVYPLFRFHHQKEKEKGREKKDVRAIPVGFSNVQPICLLDHLHPGQTRRYRGPAGGGGAAAAAASCPKVLPSSRGGSDACIDKLDEH